MELFKVFGLNFKILIAQFFNFAILFFVLYKFGYKPILKFLDDRKNEIAKGIKDAEVAQKKLIEIEEREKEIIKKAKKEALKIIEEAKERGKKRREQMIEKAKEDIGQIIEGEKIKMRAEKAETLKEIKAEIASLIVGAVEKVLEEKMDKKKDKELIEKIAKGIK